MIQKSGLLDGMAHRRGLRRWSSVARKAKELPLADLSFEAGKARKLRHYLDEFLFVADDRMALPYIGSRVVKTASGSDWSWRPEVWCSPFKTPGISSVPNNKKIWSDLTLFHDCAQSELTLRQVRNTRERDLAAYGLRLDVFGFDGSYLSLALDMPKSSLTGLKKDHVLHLETIVELEKPLEFFARLNIRHGPNTEQIVRELPLADGIIKTEFDLAYTNINEARIEAAWLDLIFENPQMSQVVLRDLAFSRHRRAEF